MYCPLVHSAARTLQSEMFCALPIYFWGHFSVPLATAWFEYWFHGGTVTSLHLKMWLYWRRIFIFFAPSASFSYWQWPSSLIAIVKGDCKEGHEASSASSSLFGCLHSSSCGGNMGVMEQYTNNPTLPDKHFLCFTQIPSYGAPASF